MSYRLPLNAPERFQINPDLIGQSSKQALKNLKYVISAVDDDALKTWNDLWEEFKGITTNSGMILPELDQGFRPACGWADFLEKFWLLKHYLDYINHLCQVASPDT
jgi:hypothetical protein